MKLDDLTIGEAKQLTRLFTCKDVNREHPFIGKKVIVRTYSAGVFYGTLVGKEKKEVVLNNAIRIWFWDGAFTLSKLAMDGTSKPENCKFAVPVNEICLEMIEIIPCTHKAQASIESVAPHGE